MKAIIVEDEQLSTAELISSLGEIAPHIEVVAVARTVDQAIEVISTTPHDLIFMDIHLGDGNSFDIFEHTNITAPVIYITAYDQYALMAFRKKGIDYLLKPFSQQELHEAVSKLAMLGRDNSTTHSIKAMAGGSGIDDGNRSDGSAGRVSGGAGGDGGAGRVSGGDGGAGRVSGGAGGDGGAGRVSGGAGNSIAGGRDISSANVSGDSHTVNSYQERFLVNIGSKMRSVAVSEIAYFMAEGKYLHLYTNDGANYIVDQTITGISDKLSPTRFFQINRKFIISFDSIKEMIKHSNNRIKVSIRPTPPSDQESIVSAERVQEFRLWLNR